MEFRKGTFEIVETISRKEVPGYEMIVFSGGEIQIRLDHSLKNTSEDHLLSINALITSAAELMELYVLCSVLSDYEICIPILNLPYFPYARQDRLMTEGEGLSARACAIFINRLGFRRVNVWDIHSDVSLALIHYVKNYEQHSFLATLPIDKRDCVLVAPDMGAAKKTMNAAKAWKLPMVQANKKRNVETGEITGTEVYSEHIGDKNFLIIDDICDGGRTFIELAKVLKPLTNGKVYLYVTHGIFSKGIDVLLEGDCIDHIFCANPWPNIREEVLKRGTSSSLTILTTTLY